MAKRQYEDTAGEHTVEDSAKRIKKEKSSRKNGAESSGHHLEQAEVNGEGKTKEERKALRRARKQQAALTEDAQDPSAQDEAAAKADRKSLRKAEKAARKASKAANGGPTSNTTNSVTTPLPPAPALANSAYTQHPALTSLPQSTIDTFTTTNHLSITDPQNQPYRPITAFSYLPITDSALLAPFSAFKEPTPIQAACWPYLFAGRDVIGVAETGSGKTLAFALPCVRAILQSKGLAKKQSNGLTKQPRGGGVRACIVSPTRELAMQIHEQLSLLTSASGLHAALVYGGVNKDAQRETLANADIVVATPGRLNDFLQEGSLDLSSVQYLVLDEADRMLDKGFEIEVRKIISATESGEEATEQGKGRQTLMFTATWPPSVRDLAGTFMHSPVRVTIGDSASSGELRANTRIEQEVHVIDEYDKQPRLISLLKAQSPKDKVLIFCLYKKEASRIEEFIRRKGFNVAGIHGDLNQQRRTEALEQFKNARVPLLVATDVAARGLDIPAVKLVVNFTFPLTVEDYVHRIGR